MTAAEQWIAKRRDHEGRGQRLHHSDYDRALDALEKVLELADGWTTRGEHLMAYSKTVPDEIGMSLLEAGADFVERARILRQTVESALGIEAGDDQ